MTLCDDRVDCEKDYKSGGFINEEANPNPLGLLGLARITSPRIIERGNILAKSNAGAIVSKQHAITIHLSSWLSKAVYRFFIVDRSGYEGISGKYCGLYIH